MVEIENNLRTIRGTIKGNAGEAIFVSSFGYVHATKFDTQDYLDKLPLIIPAKIDTFLRENWNTIDSFKLITNTNEMDVIGLELYEVKTMNYYSRKGINFGRKPTITFNALNLYRKAKELGFTVKSAWVILYENWNYNISIKPFFERDYRAWNGNPEYAKTWKKKEKKNEE